MRNTGGAPALRITSDASRSKSESRSSRMEISSIATSQSRHPCGGRDASVLAASFGHSGSARLSGISRQMHVFRADKSHRTRHQMVARNAVDQVMHLTADAPVRRVSLWRRTQLDHVHRLTRVHLDEVADTVAQRDQVLRLLG